MIDFSNKTYRNILEEQMEKVPDTLDKREGSVIQTALGPESWYLEGVYLDLDRVQRNAYAETAGGESLDLICAQRGIGRKKAVAASKKGKFNIKVPIGTRFSGLDAGNYLVYGITEALEEENGAYPYALECETAGQAGNSYTGQLQAIDYVNGLTSAVMSTLLSAGADEETDDSLRERFFATFGVPSFGGNIASYRNEILAMEGVGAIQIYPSWKGAGTVLCSILDSNFQPAGPSLVNKVQNAICPLEEGGEEPAVNGYGLAPIGASVRITTGEELTLDINCQVQFADNVQIGPETYQEEVEKKIAEYINKSRESWGDALKGQKIEYVVAIYISKIIAVILTIPAIINVTGVTVNGSSQDLLLTETAFSQQVPTLGKVVINGG